MKTLLSIFILFAAFCSQAQSPVPNIPPKFQTPTVNILLEWNASPSTGVISYVVRRGDVAGTYLEMVTIPAAQLTYTWPNADAFKSSFFAVTAKNAAGEESVYSNEVQWKPASGKLEPPVVKDIKGVTAKFKVKPPVTIEQVGTEHPSKLRIFIPLEDGEQNVMLTTTEGAFRIVEGPKLGELKP